MALKSKVFEQKLKHNGFFNFADFYGFCFDWLKDEGYSLSEKEYTEKVSSNGKEVIIKWEASKTVSDYFKNLIQVKIHILGLNDAEVEVEGKKEATNKGDLKIEISADLERDYEDKWEDNPFYKWLRGVYDKYIVRTTIDEYEDRLKDVVVEYSEQIKSYLRLEGKR